MKWKIFISYACIIVFMTVSVGFINYRIISEGLEEELLSYSDNYLVEYSKNIDNTIHELNSDLFNALMANNMLHSEYFAEFINADNDDLRELDRAQTCSVMLSANMYVRSVAFTDNYGNFYEQSLQNVENEASITKEDMKQVKKYTVLRSFGDGGFLIIKPLIDINSSEIFGTVAFEISSKFFIDQLRNVSNNEEWQVVVLDEENNILAWNRDDAKSEYKYIMDNYDIEKTNQQVYSNENGQFVFNVSSSPKGNVKIINIIPRSIIVKSSYKMVQSMLVAFGIIILLAVLMTYFTSYTITHNLNKVTSKLKEFAKGDFGTRMDVESNDELGMISREFNHMAQEIQELIDKVYKAQIQRETEHRKAVEFEYSALRAKMNPHFMYNVLEGINSMAKIHGNEDISEATCLLGDLLRNTLDDNREIFYLEEELEYIQKYLQLKVVMRKNNLVFEQDVDELLLGAKVPRFILQPIVENSFKHGIDKSVNQGYIKIKCFQYKEDLHIQVIDNGVGINKEKQKKLLQKDEHWKNTKVGLYSINKRLKILYGEEYGVKIISNTSPTIVEISMPYST